MGQGFFQLGYFAGAKVAWECRKQVRALRANLALLAGEKLEASVKGSENSISNQDSWKAGFFSGFLDKAEELRG